MRILIADDDPVYQALLGDLLTEWGHDVTTVADGQAAWEYLQEDRSLKLMILDWMMPRLNGYDLCRRLRDAPGSEEYYIILLTGSCRQEEMMRVIVAGADDFMTKPFHPEDLKIRLRSAGRILDLRQEVEELRRQLAAARAPAGA